ncbi:MAG: cytochrome c, partial [Gammaproteobacteria bacterium]|nr:cytochrome c [Gammaproteobacteria bacterium]
MVNPRVRSCLAVLIVLLSSAVAHADERATAENILHTLDYLAVDYAGAVANGQVINAKEYAEQWEFTQRVAQQIAQLAARPEQAVLREQAQTLVSAVQARNAADTVAKLCNELAANLIDEFAIVVAPRILPDLAAAPALYIENCSRCHGSSGAGDGEQAARLSPPPANLRDATRQQQRSVYSLYSTISRGVDGTSMVAFTQLTDAQRWALAFYVSNFSASSEQVQRGKQILESGTQGKLITGMAGITGGTPAALHAAQGDDGVALLLYLRAHPEALLRNVSAALDVGLTKLHASVAELRAGRKSNAYDAAVASYLQGYELVETQLRLAAPELAEKIEEKMAEYREYLGGERPVLDQATARAQELETLLEEASAQLSSNTMTPLMGAFSAFILL